MLYRSHSSNFYDTNYRSDIFNQNNVIFSERPKYSPETLNLTMKTPKKVTQFCGNSYDPSHYYNNSSFSIEQKKSIALKWSDSMVKDLLDNDFYIGTFRLKKRARNTVHGKDKRVPKEEQYIFENHHPAVIDPASFSLVQEIKEKRNRTNYRGSRGQGTGTGISNPFGCCLFCKDCGSRLTPIKRKTSNRERKYYICTTI